MKKGVHLGRSEGAGRIAFFITHLTSTLRLLRGSSSASCEYLASRAFFITLLELLHWNSLGVGR